MSEPPWVVSALERLRAMDRRLPHALLVRGERGWGQARVANAWALEALALNTTKAAKDVAHADLRWVAPEGGVIKIDAVRRTIDFLLQTPQTADRKIAVIQDADQLNLNAANALLKTLEEPPPESFLALTTGVPERLLPTVRSRCQRVSVPTVDAATLLAWFTAQGVDGDTCRLLAVEYGGAPDAVLEATQRGQPPLWPALAQIGRSASGAERLAEAFRDDGLAELTGRWLRIQCWLLRRVAPAHVEPALRFAADLATVRRLALLNSGLNKTVQLQRLVALWARIWPLLAGAGTPSLQTTGAR